ncbi:hypothetical protein TL16_g05739 [Triparma laevis f. inornata]|uniref:ubiquitinyl hydrolase 1 n=1 Tax=Triparma laevis f. inornata TaxID=1714386 RepID=A0A9W7ALX3_9STRA|nr:hypothetical protein TL16_g05739 [Triparma laevis f. inornata]
MFPDFVRVTTPGLTKLVMSAMWTLTITPDFAPSCASQPANSPPPPPTPTPTPPPPPHHPLFNLLHLNLPHPYPPSGLNECVFSSFNFHNNPSLNYNDFSAAITILNSGTISQKTKILFYVYDVERTGTVKKTKLRQFIQAIHGEKIAQSKTTGIALRELFSRTGNPSCCTFGEFFEWVKYGERHVLGGWFEDLVEGMMRKPSRKFSELEHRYNPERDIDLLIHSYKLTPTQIREIRRKHELLKRPSPTPPNKETQLGGKFTSEIFSKCSEKYFVGNLAKLVFEAGAKSVKGFWTIRDFLEFGCVAVRGKEEELFGFGFRCFDGDGDGCLDEEECQRMGEVLLEQLRFKEGKPHTNTITEEERETLGLQPGSTLETLHQQILDEVKTSSVPGSLGHPIPPSSSDSNPPHASPSNSSPKSNAPTGITLPGFIFWINLYPSRSSFLSDLSLISGGIMGEIEGGNMYNLISARWYQNWSEFETPNNSNNGGAANSNSNNSQMGRSLKRSSFSITNSPSKQFHPLNQRKPQIPPINNRELFLPNSNVQLKPGLLMDSDYKLLPPTAYNALESWYGYEGAPPISRLSTVNSFCEYNVELYPLVTHVSLCVKDEKLKLYRNEVLVSRKEKVQDFIKNMCEDLKEDPERSRLWVLKENTQHPVESHGSPQSIPHKRLEEMKNDSDVQHSNPMNGRSSPSSPSAISTDAVLALDMTFEQTVVSTNASLLLEIMNQDGTWPRARSSSPIPLQSDETKTIDETKEMEVDSSQDNIVFDGRKNKRGAKKKANGGAPPLPQLISSPSSVSMTTNGQVSIGEVGLGNLGNTCYMNATIQALSHTPVLRQYFTSKKYLNDVNGDNPLGHGGRLAHAFGNLIGDLWTTKTGGSINPKIFKDTVARVNDQFAGNEQHDAQELLTFLLNGLSEDLNRIVDKPYLENPDSDGRPDHVLADIWWRNNLQRELSIIVALFTGQFKATTTCHKCGYCSARYEPFITLQLQLPEDTMVTVPCSFVKKNGEPPIKCSVR